MSKLALFSATLLLVAIFPLPYVYYELLRILIFGSSVYFVYFTNKINAQQLSIAFGIAAATFNPFIPLHSTKEFWVVIDVSTAMLFLYASKITVNSNTELHQQIKTNQREVKN